MDLAATARYLIVETWWLEITILENHREKKSDLVTNLSWWVWLVLILVAAHYAREFYVCMLSPLDSFIRAMNDQMRQERHSKRAANSTKTSTDKSGSASNYPSPYQLSATNANDLGQGRDRTVDPQRGMKSLHSSMILRFGIWLAILHFTWPNVDLSENTSIFIYGAYISPRWWATAFSICSFASAFPLRDVLRRRTNNIQDLQDRSAIDLTFYFVQASIVITATILTVDVQWVAISVFHTRYLQLPPYQAGNSEVELRWLRDAVLVPILYPVATALCALAWQPLCIYRKAVGNYNERLALFSKRGKKADVGDDPQDAHRQPAKAIAKKEEEEARDNQQPATSDSKKEEEARETQQPARSNARKEEESSEGHGGGEALLTASVKDLVGNDWELVEDHLYKVEASDTLSEASNAASARRFVSSDVEN